MTPVLHLIFAAPGAATFRQALASVQPGDGVLLAGHGVLSVTGSAWTAALAGLDGARLGALGEDLAERGLSGCVDDAIAIIDDDAWPQWLLAYPLLRSWL